MDVRRIFEYDGIVIVGGGWVDEHCGGGRGGRAGVGEERVRQAGRTNEWNCTTSAD